MNKDELNLIQFLPASLEIQAAPPPKFARTVLWVLISFFAIAIAWACIGEIDIVATAEGKLVPSGQVKSIQSLEAGVVKKIFVDDGQFVTKGNALIALDSAINDAETIKIKQEIEAYQNDIATMNKLISYITKSNQSADLGSGTSRLLFSKVKEFQEKLLSYDFQIKNANNEKITSEAIADGFASTLPLIEERASSINKLHTNGLISHEKFLEIEQARIEHVKGLASELARVNQSKSAMESIEQEKKLYRAEFEAQSQVELITLERQLQKLEQDLKKISTVSRQQILYSPVDGVVEKLSVFTIGGVISSAQELMQIIPKGQTLVVEAGLKNKDIGFVRAGQISEIKLEAFPFMKYGVIEATVLNVSSDALEHEQLGLIFPIKAVLKKQEIFANGALIKLQPGMQATVEIKTGKRKVIEFLLAPILRGLDEGARER